MVTTKRVIAAACVLAGTLLGSSPAVALEWKLNTSAKCTDSDSTCSSGAWVDFLKYESTTDSNATVTVTTWQNTTEAAYNASSPTAGTSGTLEKNKTTFWADTTSNGVTDGGIGSWNSSAGDDSQESPYHSVDSGYDPDYTSGTTRPDKLPALDYEIVMLDFAGKLIELQSVTVGWPEANGTGDFRDSARDTKDTIYLDSDIVVLAYTREGTPDALTLRTYADLRSNGWTWIGNYANAANSPSVAVNDGSNTAGNKIASSYWLVGPYNPAISTTDALTHADEFVKIAAVAGNVYTPPPPPPPPGGGGTTGGVPVPGVLPLLVFGLGLIGWQRRRFAA